MRSFLFTSIASLVLFACQSKKDKVSDSVSFRIDNTLLGATFKDTISRISIRVPKDWESIEQKTDSTSAKIKELLKANGQITQVKKVYLDQISLLSSLSIMRIDKRDSIQIVKAYQNPDSILNSQKQWDSINKAEFNYHGIKFKQFILFNENLVNIKLICSKLNSVEFDFLLTQEEYKRNVKKIESSIGSIAVDN